MNALTSEVFSPFHLHRQPRRFAGPAPLRLLELHEFNAGDNQECTNPVAMQHRARRARGYLQMPGLPAKFLVR
jgi:hypothetical protein